MDAVDNDEVQVGTEMCMPETGGNFVKDGKVYILGYFDSSISTNVVPELVKLIDINRSKKNSAIPFYINSFGGYAKELLALLSLISIAKGYGIKIITVNLGVAASCGSILAIHGDMRYMYRYSTNMMHLGTNGACWKTFEEMGRVFKKSKNWFGNIVKFYLDNTKMKKTEIEKILKDDGFSLTAEECLKKGFCDEII